MLPPDRELITARPPSLLLICSEFVLDAPCTQLEAPLGLVFGFLGTRPHGAGCLRLFPGTLPSKHVEMDTTCPQGPLLQGKPLGLFGMTSSPSWLLHLRRTWFLSIPGRHGPWSGMGPPRC